jgi:hypothetical protein
MNETLLPVLIASILIVLPPAAVGCRYNNSKVPVRAAPVKAAAAKVPADVEELCRKGGTPEEVCDLIVRLEEGPAPAEAAMELGRLEPAPSVAALALAKALGHPDAQVREESAKSLGRIGALVAIPFLAKALEDGSGQVRRAAFEALEEIGGGSFPDGVILPDAMREERCLMGAKAYRDVEPKFHMEAAAQLVIGSECNAMAGVGKPSSPEEKFALLAWAAQSLPETCQPFCRNAWEALAAMEPVVKRPALSWICPGFYRFDLSRFTFEVFMVLLSLDACEDYLEAFEGIGLFGGHSLTSVPYGSKIAAGKDLPPGSFASVIDPEANWVDVVVTVSQEGVKVAWPNVIGVVEGQVMWLDEAGGYRFPGKAVSVEKAREDLGKVMAVTPVDPPLLAVAAGTGMKKLREALKNGARLTVAPDVVLSAEKCPKGAARVFPGKGEMYDIEYSTGTRESAGKADIGERLSKIEAACLVKFDSVEAVQNLVYRIQNASPGGERAAPKIFIAK